MQFSEHQRKEKVPLLLSREANEKTGKERRDDNSNDINKTRDPGCNDLIKPHEGEL